MTTLDVRDSRGTSRPRNDRTTRFGEQPALLDPDGVARRQPPPPPPVPVPEPPPPPVPFAHLPAAFRRAARDPDEFAVTDRVTVNLATSPWMPQMWEWGQVEPLPDGSTVQVVPDAGLVGFIAQPGIGKGFLTARYIGCGTTGEPYPLMPATARRRPRDYIIIAPEDRRETALVPKLLAAGADMSRVHDLTWYRGSKLRLPDDMPVLMAAIRDLTCPEAVAAGADFGGVCIDPIGACADIGTKRAATATLQPLFDLAETWQIPVWFTGHTNWDGGIQGSIAVQSIPRMVWYLSRSAADQSIVEMSLTGPTGKGKANITSRAQTYRFTVKERVAGERVTACAQFIDADYENQLATGRGRDAAMAWWADNAYVVTDAQPRVTVPGAVDGGQRLALEPPPCDDDAVIRAARKLAETIGGDYDTAAPVQQHQYRVMAQGALQAAR